MYLWLYTMSKISSRSALSNPIGCRSSTELHIICIRDRFKALVGIATKSACCLSRSELDGAKRRKSNSRKDKHRRAFVLMVYLRFQPRQILMAALPWSPEISLIVSNACIFPMIPVTTPKIPNSSQDPKVSFFGGIGNRHR